MRPEQLEFRVQQSINSAKKNRKIEDSRIEAKFEWIDAQKAARRLAGHANATGGDWVLWIIGLDEKTGEVKTPHVEDLADWKAKLYSHFHGVQPALIHDYWIDLGDERVLALFFDVRRRPFVVRVPRDSKNTDLLEVPWREGTSLRSARHEDLIRMLVPQQAVPDIEVLGADIAVYERDLSQPGDPVLQITLRCFVTPSAAPRIVFARHRSHLMMGELSISPVTFGPVSNNALPTRMLVWASHDGSAVIDGPGELSVSLRLDSKRLIPASTDFEVGLQLGLAGSEQANIFRLVRVTACAPNGGAIAAWCLDPSY